jgi:signal transduction histidine kinase
LDDLLDVDRFARGNITAVRVPTDLTVLVEAAIEEEDLGDHAVELDLAPVMMDLDAPWVERVVANLLRNVARHTPPRTRIWVRTRATADGVELTVDDDGPGIPEADRQCVVEPFQQGDNAGSAAQPGTGVGLSLVNAVGQMHAGNLLITDSRAGGTWVTVTLTHAGPDMPTLPSGNPVSPDGVAAAPWDSGGSAAATRMPVTSGW